MHRQKASMPNSRVSVPWFAVSVTSNSSSSVSLLSLPNLFSNYLSYDPVSILLDSDIDDETVVSIVLNHLTVEEANSFQESLAKLACKKNERAQNIIGILQIANSYQGGFIDDVKDLPAIPQRNHVIYKLILVEPRSTRVDLYEKLRPLIITEDPQAFKDRLNSSFESSEFYFQVLNSLNDGGVNKIYEDIFLGTTNTTADKIANLAWQSAIETQEFTKAGFAEKLERIKAFFPAISLARDKALVEDCGAQTSEEWYQVLEAVKTPISRYSAGEEILSLQDELENPTLEQRLQSLCLAFPEEYFYRDKKINDVLLSNRCTNDDIKAAKKLLYSENTIQHSSPEQIYHLFAVRFMAQFLYTGNTALKSMAFNKLASMANKDDRHRQFLTLTEREELLNSLFSGKNSIIDTADFEIALKELFLLKIFSEEEVSKLVELEKLKKKFDELLKSNVLLDLQFIIDRLKSILSTQNKDCHLAENMTNDETLATIKNLSLEELRKIYAEDYSIHVLILKELIKKLKATITPEIFGKLPMLQRVFLEVVRALPKDKQNRSMSKFLAQIVDYNDKDMGEMIVAFAESLGPLYIKAMQYLASIGYFDKDLQLKLLKLTSSVVPMTVFQIWDILKEEFKDDHLVASLGPLLGTASTRQAHLMTTEDGANGVIKIKRPSAVHGIEADISSLKRFIERTRQDTTILHGIILPEDLVSEIGELAKKEIETTDDHVHQAAFHASHNGKTIGSKTLRIPILDISHSTSIVTVESIAPGEPLSRRDSLTQEDKNALLEFLLEMIFEEGKFHGDPHPGNIIVGEEDISLIDFGMMGTLSKKNRYYFFQILGCLLSKQTEELMRLLIEIHLSNRRNLKGLDPKIIRRGLELYLQEVKSGELNFNDIALGLLNTLESLNIKLPAELKNLIKVIGQMGYLIRGQEEFLQNWLGSFLMKKSSELKIKDIKIQKTAREFMKHDQMENQRILHLPARSLIRDTQHPEKTYQLPNNIAIDPTAPVRDFLMLDVGDCKLGLLPGRNNYQIHIGGRWYDLEKLLFNKIGNQR